MTRRPLWRHPTTRLVSKSTPGDRKSALVLLNDCTIILIHILVVLGRMLVLTTWTIDSLSFMKNLIMLYMYCESDKWRSMWIIGFAFSFTCRLCAFLVQFLTVWTFTSKLCWKVGCSRSLVLIVHRPHGSLYYSVPVGDLLLSKTPSSKCAFIRASVLSTLLEFLVWYHLFGAFSTHLSHVKREAAIVHTCIPAAVITRDVN